MDYKKYYDIIGNDWFSNRKTLWSKYLPKNQVITPRCIIEKMFSKVIIDWANPNLKICDPCCGSGSFLIYCMIKLLEAGHSEKYIIENMLYGTDIDPRCIKFIEVFWKFNRYKHNLRTSSILSTDWSFKNMQFDLIIMNPPYKIGGKIAKASILQLKDTGKMVNLMPLNQYKKGLYKHINDFELADPTAFNDANIPYNLNISVLTKKAVDKYTWDQLIYLALDYNYLEFYKWNIANNKNITMYQQNYKDFTEFNIDTDFVEIARAYSKDSGAGFGKDGCGYRFNVLKKDYQKDWLTSIGVINFSSKKAKDNFCKYWYNGKKGESLASRMILGTHIINASAIGYMGIPQIDWEGIENNILWQTNQYDEAVLDVMGLKWDTNKEKIINK